MESTALLGQIRYLVEECRRKERDHAAEIAAVRSHFRASAANLIHYLALRGHDLRELQPELSARGLSSLGRSEPHVLATLEAVERTLVSLTTGVAPVSMAEPLAAFREGPARLAAHAESTLGPTTPGRSGRVMVTMPSEAGVDAALVESLVRHGMDVARINSAHDGPEVWRGMVENLRQAAERAGRPIRIAFDLSGPKLRTGGEAADAIHVEPGMTLRLAGGGGHLTLERVPCTLPEVFAMVKPGERIFFDDGKIEGVIQEATPDGLLVKIERTRIGGAKLSPDKGLNFPDSDLRLPSLTAKDRADLDFAAGMVDLIGLSFVKDPADITALLDQLRLRHADHLGVILKIESHAAFENLPRLLLAGMQTPQLAVMVARGDLGVEVGFDRLAEVQEEILWLCEAAHVPVIWATQVLESLNKKGQPSRAEVTDAAMSVRAECVMLNKGPYVLETLDFLDRVLRRMEAHQRKKQSMLRKLRVSALDPVEE